MKEKKYDLKTQSEILITIWITLVLSISVAFFLYAQNDMIKFLGQKIKVLALEIAQNTVLTHEDVTLLREIDYDALLDHPLNQAFESRARKLMKDSNIKYIYLESIAPESPYKVNPDEVTLYGAKEGSQLDSIFLLSATRSDQERAIDDGPRPLNDKRRYTIMDSTTRFAFESQSTLFYRSQDLWGKYITGFSPIYDTSENFIGLIGVDLDISVYYKALLKYILLILFFITTNLVMVTLIYKLAFKVEKHKLLSDHDALTGVYSRRRIWEIMVENWHFHLKAALPLCLIIVDIDHFKEYNDFYGHEPGDKVLTKVAALLKKQAELESGFVGRYGGDEFILVLPNVSHDRKEVIVSRMTSAMKQLNIEHQKSPIGNFLTTSVGGVLGIPDPSLPIEEMFIKADECLYKVKDAGRNNIYILTLD